MVANPKSLSVGRGGVGWWKLWLLISNETSVARLIPEQIYFTFVYLEILKANYLK